MIADNYHKNFETIARGKGSPQARYHDEECELCNEEEKDEPSEHPKLLTEAK